MFSRVEAWEGQGAYGTVYRAVRAGQEHSGPVALKLSLSSERAPDKPVRQLDRLGQRAPDKPVRQLDRFGKSAPRAPRID